MNDLQFSIVPTRPKDSHIIDQRFCLSDAIIQLAQEHIDSGIEEKIHSCLDKWNRGDIGSPISDLRVIVEPIRMTPPSFRRLQLMNSFLRVFSRPQIITKYLEALVIASQDNRSGDSELINRLKDDTLHSMYGWCGNCQIFYTSSAPLPYYGIKSKKLQRQMGYPVGVWGINIHVWQPNSSAIPFKVKGNLPSNIITEPPHSHPFDFVSIVLKGRVHQSTYYPCKNEDSASSSISTYKGFGFEHVDGVWPPHTNKNKCYLKTLEHRVLIEEGGAYFMPLEVVHDVQVEKNVASKTPAISLFFASEYYSPAHVYTTKEMIDFHNRNPFLKYEGSKLSSSQWEKKLIYISEYLLNTRETLNLNPIVKHRKSYSFLLNAQS
ncbi:hypothetical protein [Cyclobacterium sp. SYSU L10401]|uniref:hypothetical protein n=1 Tax=Cyclobacterium sp. SYSU L10401 TaxID=2678657 RepID=UPI0013D00F9B|nr:hypothetical protein [Cyclobacterium sp. SYSU L10401]